MIDIFRKGNSVSDWGTYASNAIISGNGNAICDVLGDNYDKIKEFFQIETDAFIIATSLRHFGMDKVTDRPTTNCFPGDLKMPVLLKNVNGFITKCIPWLRCMSWIAWSHLRTTDMWLMTSNVVSAEFGTSRNATICLRMAS